MGKRYTKDEISRIQTLTEQGLTSNKIASLLGRPEAGIRNIRYRMKIRAKQKEDIGRLKEDKLKLNQNIARLRSDLQMLQSRKERLEKALQLDEANFKIRNISDLKSIL